MDALPGGVGSRASALGHREIEIVTSDGGREREGERERERERERKRERAKERDRERLLRTHAYTNVYDLWVVWTSRSLIVLSWWDLAEIRLRCSSDGWMAHVVLAVKLLHFSDGPKILPPRITETPGWKIFGIRVVSREQKHLFAIIAFFLRDTF